MLKQGSFIATRYEIFEKIGTGGMSDVYRATDVVLGRQVAVKVLKEEFAQDESFVSKFRSEASNAAKLEHPNIVNIYDVGSEDGLYYIIMEYVEGITLKTYIEKKGHLNYKEVISIAIQVARGVEAAHNNKIIHRDIKPQNIIISKEGKVKVTDFGIARAVSRNTVSAEAIGSVHYISPEQARNGYITEKSDIYSLGIVMYEMCTGKVPFEGDTAVSIALKHLQGEMKSPRELVSTVPISLEMIIKKATMKSPDKRYNSVLELLTDLKKALVSPNEDFVVFLDNNDMDKTRIITKDDIDQIKDNSLKKDNSNKKLKNKKIMIESDDEDDDRLNPKMEKAVTIMGIAAGIIIALVLIYMIGSMLGWFKFYSNKKGDTGIEDMKGNIKVPDVLGMSEDDARSAILEKGLKFKNVGTESSDRYGKGKACKQSIKAGRKVTKGSVVKVIFSSGLSDEEKEVPNVEGLSEMDARKKIDEAGFSISVNYKETDEVEPNTVISQSPKSGSKLNERKTIIINVSKKKEQKEQAKVPNVKDITLSNAKSILTTAGFDYDIKTQNSDKPKDTVIAQSPEGGTLEKGKKVLLIVSIGKAENNNTNNNHNGNNSPVPPINNNENTGEKPSENNTSNTQSAPNED